MIFYQCNDLQSRHQRELIHLWNIISSICSCRASGSQTRQARTSSKTFSVWRSSLRGSPALKVRLFSLLDLCWNFFSCYRWRTPLYGLLDRRQRQCDVREQRPAGLYLHVFIIVFVFALHCICIALYSHYIVFALHFICIALYFISMHLYCIVFACTHQETNIAHAQVFAYNGWIYLLGFLMESYKSQNQTQTLWTTITQAHHTHIFYKLCV